jgi:hypothetical protein
MKKFLLATALASFAFATAANAGTISVSLGSGPNLYAFNNDPLDSTAGTTETLYGLASYSTTPGTNTGSFVTDTSSSGLYLQPAGDAGKYIFAAGGGSVAVTWTNTVYSFDIYWGSPDTYNTLTLSNGDSIGGSAVLALTGTPSGSNSGTSWIQVSDTAGFNGFTASSSQNAFEFDLAAIPEASTWAMMLLGFAGLGFVGYRKAKSGATVRFAD